MNRAAPGEHPSRDAGHRSPEELLVRVATGDEAAFQQLYAVVAGPVFGLVRRVVRDAAQSEEVTQEVLVELWRTASHYHPDRGGALTWVLTMAHRRAVDRVRCTQGRTDLEQRAATRVADRAFDEVSETVTANLDREQVRRCLATLTPMQRESITLAYYGGRTYTEVAQLLQISLDTAKTRLRDGLIRLRDCVGASR